MSGVLASQGHVAHGATAGASRIVSTEPVLLESPLRQIAMQFELLGQIALDFSPPPPETDQANDPAHG